MDTRIPAYSHTQKAPLCLIFYGSALACFVLAWILPSGNLIVAAAAFLSAFLAMAFHQLTVEDQGDKLVIRFGQLPLFRRTVNYANMVEVEVGRTTIFEGWGIHLSLRGGWVWNIWGRDCVVVHFRNGGVLRIGTDDAENLVDFLRSKVRE